MLLNGVSLISRIQLVLFFTFLLYACGGGEVYDKLPKKSALTREVFQKSSKIIRYKKDLILDYSYQVGEDRYRAYLLFYDNKLNLSGACDFDAIRIENIRNDTVFGIINEFSPPRIIFPMCDLPKNYNRVLKILKLSSGNRIRNKIIDSIKINFKNLELELYIRKSDDNVWADFKGIKNSDFSQNFTKSEIHRYKISDLNYCYKNQIITYEKVNNNGVIQDEMIILDKKVFDKFYADLWNTLVKPIEHSLE
jgi:hypothetical protein